MPYVALGAYPTPVERLALPGIGAPLYLKRDDLASPHLGGNKVRALEYLLAGVTDRDTLLTGGGEGSTHVLATTVHAARLGIRVRAVRWRHDMHDVAHAVSERVLREGAEIETSAMAWSGVLRTLWRRLTGTARWIPFGGTSPLGILGHVNAGLELADQITAGEIPVPARIVVPLGTGGTVAGIALGMACAGRTVPVVGARVVPRIASNHQRIMHLISATRRWVRRHHGVEMPAVDPRAVRVVHDVFGGAYGRELPRAQEAARVMAEARGIVLDATYSAKAFAAALQIARSHDDPTLFWCTFDARWLDPSSASVPEQRPSSDARRDRSPRDRV